jgi:hypothetical protein
MRKLSVVLQLRGTAAVAAALVLAGSVALAACGTASAVRQHPSGPFASPTQADGRAGSSSPASAPDGGGTLAGFRVLSMTFVSPQQGFALGTVACGTVRCATVLGTVDGGRAWRQLTAPTRAAASTHDTCPGGQPCVGQIRFASPLIGYAYDPSPFITTDGGMRWRRLPGVDVSSLETADGTVDRVVSGEAGCSGMRYRAESAPVGSGAWRELPAPATQRICPPVLYRQGESVVLVGYGNPAGGVRATAQIDRSGNAGQTWVSGPDSCGGKDGYASGVALAPPDVLVLLCQHQLPGPGGVFGPAWVRVSVDGGARFGPDRTVPSVSAAAGTILRYQLAAASSGRLLVVETSEHGSQVLLTDDGGQSWSTSLRLSAAGSVVLVGFEDPRTGRIAQGDRVWTTGDGGRAWAADRF